MDELREIVKEIKLENELQKIQKTAQNIEKPLEAESESSFVSDLEKQLRAEKAIQHIEKVQTQQSSAEQIAKRMNTLEPV